MRHYAIIKEVPMYTWVCDNCGTQWHDEHMGWCAVIDELSLRDLLNDSDWKEDPNDDTKFYCPDCYSYNDDDELILKTIDK